LRHEPFIGIDPNPRKEIPALLGNGLTVIAGAATELTDGRSRRFFHFAVGREASRRYRVHQTEERMLEQSMLLAYPDGDSDPAL